MKQHVLFDFRDQYYTTLCGQIFGALPLIIEALEQGGDRDSHLRCYYMETVINEPTYFYLYQLLEPVHVCVLSI